MADLAPAPAQRMFDGVGRTPEQNFTGRKKAAKKLPPVAAKKPDAEPDVASDPEPEANHQLDLLA